MIWHVPGPYRDPNRPASERLTDAGAGFSLPAPETTESVRMVPLHALESRAAWLDQVATLFYAAVPDYYDLIPLPMSERLTFIRAQLRRKVGGVCPTVIALGAQGVLGAYEAFPASELEETRLSGVLSLLRAIPAQARAVARTRMNIHGKGLPPAPADTIYLSRLATAPAHRGRGIGHLMLRDLFARQAGNSFSLHVRSSNVRAMALYEETGFRPVDTRLVYHLMVRMAD